MVPHPEYAKPAAYYDVAVIHLKEKVEFTDNIAPICIPEKMSERKELDGKLVTLTGWGMENVMEWEPSETLRRTVISVYSEK